MAENNDFNDADHADIISVSRQQSDASQSNFTKTSNIPKRKPNHITQSKPQATKSTYRVNPFSFLLDNSDQFKLIP